VNFEHLLQPGIAIPSAIIAAAVLGIVVQPWRLPEYLWAVAGALGLVACGTLAVHQAAAAAWEGKDVYAFLLGMMLLSELAREHGLFDWIADLALRHAGGRALGLFNVVFLLGVGVTAVLSNDATAVVLTPAVLAIAQRARSDPMPALFACAMVANAASFVLPISNPANLVVFGDHMPGFASWTLRFLLPSAVSIATTYVALRLCFREALAAPLPQAATVLDPDGEAAAAPRLTTLQRVLLLAFVGIAAALMVVVSKGGALGTWTLGLTLVLDAGVCLQARAWPGVLVHHLSWQIFPLVGGLFVLVAGAEKLGAVGLAARWLAAPRGTAGEAGVAWLVGLLCNLANNLPVGLFAGLVNGHGQVPEKLADLLLLAIDLGPNLAITGSLATLLWLAAMRRAKLEVSFFSFLKVGLAVMPLPLGLTLLSRLLLG
jgi:arsenical pump membrane protein